MHDPNSLRPSTSAGILAAHFADQLAGLRAASGETQKQLAARLGMTESMISRLESGAHVPSLATLCRIADGFGRRLEIVFHDHAHEHPGGIRHAHPHAHAVAADNHVHQHERSGGISADPRRWI